MLAAQTTDKGQEQENNLFAGRQLAVERAVEALPQWDQRNKDQLLEYLSNNCYRTCYNLYRKQDLMISSGPIEAANGVGEIEKKRAKMVREGL